MYPVAQPGFHGGTETYLKRIASGLAGKGHVVHVVAPDQGKMEQRGAREFWWGSEVFPTDVNAVVMVPGLEMVEPYEADILVCMSNGVDPYLGPDQSWGVGVDAFPVFSECHRKMLCECRKVDPEKCFITGLGVDIDEYDPLLPKVPARLLWSNDPTRGLYHLLDVFRHLKRQVLEATLHIGYSFERQFEHQRWQASATAEALWECRRHIAEDPAITVLPEIDHATLVGEIQACSIHVMPSDPTGAGTQIHGMLQMEMVAAGVPMVLSDTEAFPEVFGEVATILPLPGAFIPELESRYDAQDWADVTAEILADPEKQRQMASAGRVLAEKNDWSCVVDRWDSMLTTLEARRGH